MSKCDVCNNYKTEQQKEPSICHESPTRPWESIAADLYVFHGKDYLVTTDHYANFFEVDRLYSKSSSEVITKMKALSRDMAYPTSLCQTMAQTSQAESSSYLLTATTLSILLVHQHTLNQMVKRRICENSQEDHAEST